MRYTLWLILLFPLSQPSFAQIENLIFGTPAEPAKPVVVPLHNYRFLSPQDSIFLSFDYFNQKVFQHVAGAGQTLYAISRYYGLPLEELYFYNPGLRDGALQPGQPVTIPLPNRAIIRYQTPGFDTTHHAPVYYVVRQGDTMYNICRRHFRMPVDTIRLRNRLDDITLRPGQVLHVGWMSIEGIPEEFRQNAMDPLTRLNSAMREAYYQSTAMGPTAEQRGAAFWKKDSRENSDFYALHRYAALNSVIEVENPMTNRRVYLKVIGRIPDRAYEDEVVVVLSPLAAKTLLAKDPRFFVRVTYPK